MARKKTSVLAKAHDVIRQHRDSLVNAITALGTERDPRSHSYYVSRPIEPRLLAEVYAASGVSARLCDLPAKEMTRGWWDFKATLKKDQKRAEEVARYVRMREEELGMASAFREAETWALAEGGALLVVGVDDGERRMSAPVRNGRHRVLWLRVFEAADAQIVSYNTDPRSRRYGKPEHYRVNRRSGGEWGDTLVHASRVLHFRGLPTTSEWRGYASGWDMSAIQRCYERVRDLESAMAGVGRMESEFGQPVITLSKLVDILGGGNRELIEARINTMILGKSLANAVVLDENDKFERNSPTVAGLADLLDRNWEAVVALRGIPITKFLGRAPAGLNATGDSDIRFWYDDVNADQWERHGPLLEVGRLFLMNEPECPATPEDLDDWEQEPFPLWQPSAQEQATTNQVKATMIAALSSSMSGQPLISREEGRAYIEAEGLAVLSDEGVTSSPALMSALAKLSQRSLPPKSEPPATVAAPTPEVLPPETSAPAPTINELSLAVERFGRLGDVDMVNTLRAALAKQFGLPAPPALTAEEMAAVRARVTGAEASAEASAEARAKGDAARRDQEPFDSILAAFSDEFLDLLADALEAEGAKLGEEELRRLGMTTGFNVQNPYYVKALEEFKLRHLPEINATTRDALSIIFAEYSEAGLGRDALVRRMRDVYGEFSQTRAEGIARTEMTMVQSAANYAAWDETEEIEEVEWSARMVNTRPSHASMHGQRRKHGEPFESGAGNKALHPGGFGDPSEDCNCACVLLPVTVLSDRADSAARADARRRDAQAEQDIARLREEAIERFTRLTYEALMEQFDKAVRK